MSEHVPCACECHDSACAACGHEWREPTPDTLGDAWSEVVRRLPEGWRIEDLYRSSVGGEGDDWWHVLMVEPYTDDGTSHEGEQAILEGHGPTPVEALRSAALNAAAHPEPTR